MRGRTLNDSFIVIDEAQNCTYGQLKMLLTRLGLALDHGADGRSGSDRPAERPVGVARRGPRTQLEKVPDIAVIWLGEGDIVRHPLVAGMLTVL